MLGNGAARSLAQSELAKGLTCLMLEANNIGPEGARVFAESKHFQNLEELFLDFNPIGVEGIQALADFKQLSKAWKPCTWIPPRVAMAEPLRWHTRKP